MAAVEAEIVSIRLGAKAGSGLAASSTVRQHFHNQNWFVLPSEDARQNEFFDDFRKYIARSVRKDCPSLELGPSFSPILPKASGYDVAILDHADQAQLVEKYAAHGMDVSKIEPVDIVWSGVSMATALDGRKFEAIVAAHVIEHAPDFIQFLKDCSRVLNDDGSIYLLVPDKRYAFDFLQPLSDVGKILGDHRAKRTRHSFESFYRLSACVRNGDLLAWDQSGISHLTFLHGDPINMRQIAEQYAGSEPYVDTHENFFTPISFAMIVDELRYLGEIDLDLTVLTRSRGCEFLAVLRKGSETNGTSSEAFLARKMDAYRLLLLEEQERLNSASHLLAT